MRNPDNVPPYRSESFDQIALDLRALRAADGSASYAELVRRITSIRIHRGVQPAAATPARSTVYDVFKTGRTRVDVALLRDIVLALGADEDTAELWARRCSAARAAQEDGSKARVHRVPSAPLPQTPSRPAVAPRLSRTAIALLLAAAVVINLLGLYLVGVFRLSVYLDMVGTALAAIVLGPWPGVAVAVASNGLGFLTGDMHTLEFMPVNIAGALVWGYGVRRFGFGADLSRYVSLNFLAALVCSLVAAPIVVAVFFGEAGHASNLAVLSLEARQVPFVVSVFTTNIVTSILDKLLTGFIVLLALILLHNRGGLPAGHMPLVEKLGALRVVLPTRVPHATRSRILP